MKGFHIKYTGCGAVAYACTVISMHYSFEYKNKNNIVIIDSSVVIYSVS